MESKSGPNGEKKVASFKPDVVIAADDNAQAYFAKDYVGKLKPQFVFCGVNAAASTYGYPSSNMTGILERIFFIQSLELLRQIKRDVRTIAIIGDDGLTFNLVLVYIKTLQSPLKVVSFDQPSTFHEWQAWIRKYQATANAIAIRVYQTVKHLPGAESMSPKEVTAWTVANYKKPMVGFLGFAMTDGVLCGIAESAEEHGLLSAEIAIKILQEKKAGDFPLKTAQKGTVIINV